MTDAAEHHREGLLRLGDGRPAEAVDEFAAAVAAEPGNPEYHKNLGKAYRLCGDLDAAIACYRRAIEIDPEYMPALNNLAVIYIGKGRAEEAEALLLRARKSYPEDSDLLVNLGVAQSMQGKLDEAFGSLRAGLTINPEDRLGWDNVINLVRHVGHVGDSAETMRFIADILHRRPDFGFLHHLQGWVLHMRGDTRAARASYERAIELEPDNAGAHDNLGALHFIEFRLDEAIIHDRRALELQPDLAEAHSNLLLALQYKPGITPDEIYREHRRFSEQHELPLRAEHQLHLNARDPERRIRVGYISADLREHSVAYFVEPILARHDRSRFEIHCYHTHRSTDSFSQRIAALSDRWLHCPDLSESELAARVRNDGIDILVDLSGHTSNNRLLVFARKPAPVQVTWIGYPCTTGLESIDYRITDLHSEPPGLTERYNSEELWRLPHFFCCYQAPANGPLPIDHPPCDDNGHVIFGSFNNFAKVSDQVLRLWGEILREVSDARLLFEIYGISSPHLREEILGRLRRAGISVDRVLLEPRTKANQFVLYNRVDIALDPFPCNGGTTSLDTLWMGVPLIALAGEHFASRMGTSILTNAGLSEFVADRPETYVRLAVELARDRERLRRVRHNLRQRICESPLMDSATFTQDLEHAYREMWRRWCRTSSEA